jgi:hypothetical protein
MPVTISAVSIMSFTPTGMPSIAESVRPPAFRRGLGCGAGRRSVDHREGADRRLAPFDLGQAFQHSHRLVGTFGTHCGIVFRVAHN